MSPASTADVLRRVDEETGLLPSPRSDDGTSSSSSFASTEQTEQAPTADGSDISSCHENDCPPFDDSAALERIDCTRPLGPGNTAVTSKELLCPNGDGEEMRRLQHELHAAVLEKDGMRVKRAVDAISTSGRARNFMAVLGLLATGRRTGWVADRRYDDSFDGGLFEVLSEATAVPTKYLQPLSMMRAALSISDPLLLVTAIEAGADVNDKSLGVPALKNARCRGKSYMVDILRRAGAEDRKASLLPPLPPRKGSSLM